LKEAVQGMSILNELEAELKIGMMINLLIDKRLTGQEKFDSVIGDLSTISFE
jgi:hypothetical protein